MIAPLHIFRSCSTMAVGGKLASMLQEAEAG
jgi:hypothetical protein